MVPRPRRCKATARDGAEGEVVVVVRGVREGSEVDKMPVEENGFALRCSSCRRCVQLQREGLRGYGP